MYHEWKAQWISSQPLYGPRLFQHGGFLTKCYRPGPIGQSKGFRSLKNTPLQTMLEILVGRQWISNAMLVLGIHMLRRADKITIQLTKALCSKP